MTDPLEGLAACGSQALRRITLATLYNGPTVQRKKIQKILQRQTTHAASRSNDPHRGPRQAGVQTRATSGGAGQRATYGRVYTGSIRFSTALVASP